MSLKLFCQITADIPYTQHTKCCKLLFRLLSCKDFSVLTILVLLESYIQFGVTCSSVVKNSGEQITLGYTPKPNYRISYFLNLGAESRISNYVGFIRGQIDGFIRPSKNATKNEKIHLTLFFLILIEHFNIESLINLQLYFE